MGIRVTHGNITTHVGTVKTGMAADTGRCDSEVSGERQNGRKSKMLKVSKM
jgi:hypothetical protein